MPEDIDPDLAGLSPQEIAAVQDERFEILCSHAAPEQLEAVGIDRALSYPGWSSREEHGRERHR